MWVDERARAVIEEEAKGKRFVETGGPLFGFEGEDAVVVACAYGPGPRAKHRPWSLVADRAATQATIRAVHGHSEGRYRYLGSWHTHPFGRAVPSLRDAKTAHDIALQKGVRLPHPLLLIEATRAAWLTVRVTDLVAFFWDARARELVEVELQRFSLEERLCLEL